MNVEVKHTFLPVHCMDMTDQLRADATSSVQRLQSSQHRPEGQMDHSDVRKKRLFCHAVRHRDCPAHGQVTVLTELPYFLSG